MKKTQTLFEAYKYCPRCAAALSKTEHALECPSCGLKIFNNPAPCSGVILTNKRGDILLVKRKYPPQQGYWDLPGGFFDGKEDLETSVQREIREELGLEVKLKDIIGVYADEYEYQQILRPTLGFVVTAEIVHGKVEVKDDVSDYAFFSRDDVLQQKLAFEGIRSGLRDYLQKHR